MSIWMIILCSCFSMDVSGKLKHEHDVNVKIKFVDDTGDTGGRYEPILK